MQVLLASLIEVSPSGKLPITLYSTENTLPEFTDYSMKGRTYRYMEEKPLYPFGYGLTYGNVCIKDVKYEDEILNVIVKNDSDRKVKDVIEVYVKNHETKYAPLNPVLCGFKKIELDAGEEKSVEVVISERAFQVVNENGEFIKDVSSSTLYVATSGVEERSEELTGVCPKEINIKW